MAVFCSDKSANFKLLKSNRVWETSSCNLRVYGGVTAESLTRTLDKRLRGSTRLEWPIPIVPGGAQYPFLNMVPLTSCTFIFGSGRRVPKSHSSCCCRRRCCCCCCYHFSKNPQGFVNTQRSATNFAYTFVLTFPTDLLSQIFSWRNGIISVIKVRLMLSI